MKNIIHFPFCIKERKETKKGGGGGGRIEYLRGSVL